MLILISINNVGYPTIESSKGALITDKAFCSTRTGEVAIDGGRKGS
jgi:hypothetical protein